VLKNLTAIFKAKARQAFSVKEREDFRSLYTDPPIPYAGTYPEVPKPEPRLSPTLLAARWVSHDLYGENMPRVASDLLEFGFNTPSMRRLAGEMQVNCSADVEVLVGRMFRELSVPYPISETQAKTIFTRQVAREVIAGERNAWAAASHLEIVVWGWEAESPDLQALFSLNDEIDWDTAYRRPLPTLTSELIGVFARLGARADGEKRPLRSGLLEGEGWIADDFNGPLPDDLLAQFEGRDEPPAE
jgi:DNA-binding transcriptional regulator YhcF (GntR family)